MSVLSEDERKVQRKAYRTAWRAANPGYMTAYYAANPEKVRMKTLRKYGLTIDTYDALLKSQDGTCAICDCVCKTGRSLAVDHDHDTKKNRGLLCGGCNTSLGKLKDSPAVLSTALRYLLDHGKAFSTEDATILLDKLHHYAKD